MTVGSRGEGLIAGRVALRPSSFECPAFMIKNLCMYLEIVQVSPSLKIHLRASR